MINFEHESLEVALKKAYDNVRGLKRKTKELIMCGTYSDDAGNLRTV